MYVAQPLVKSKQAAEGIVEEALIKFWRKRNTFNLEDHALKPLLVTIVQRLSLYHLKKQATRKSYDRELFHLFLSVAPLSHLSRSGTSPSDDYL